MTEKPKQHNLSTRLTDAQYRALESYRARRGARSLNAAVGLLIDEAASRESTVTGK